MTISRGRRFRTRRQWQSTLLWSLASLFLLICGVIAGAAIGAFAAFSVVMVTVLAGFVVSGIQDSSRHCSYHLEGEVLHLQSLRHQEDIPLSDILDASQLDPRAARDFMQQKLRKDMEEGLSVAQARQREQAFIRFCSVDIGMRSYTFGLGRVLMERFPNARRDLVLIRMRDGDVRLLSPVHNQDLVECLGRAARNKMRA